jgi:hypothetical protein
VFAPPEPMASETLNPPIDQHLSWKTNTESICKKITSGISALRRLKEFADKQTLLSVYNNLLFAHILLTAVKYGMCLEKRNKKDSKNYKTELLGLF